MTIENQIAAYKSYIKGYILEGRKFKYTHQDIVSTFNLIFNIVTDNITLKKGVMYPKQLMEKSEQYISAIKQVFKQENYSPAQIEILMDYTEYLILLKIIKINK